MEELLNILRALKPGVDFAGEDDLVGDHILDSLDIVTLAAELCDRYDIEITPLDVVPENFRSAAAIYAMVQRLQEA